MRNRWIEAGNNRIPLPDSLPAYGEFVAGTDGRTWVQNPRVPERYPVMWTAYDDGVPSARVELPPRFVPTQFGPDWVLGIAQDILDVERVMLVRFRPATPDRRREYSAAEALHRSVIAGCLIAWP